MSVSTAGPDRGSFAPTGEIGGRPLLELALDRSHVRDHWSLCGRIADYVTMFCLPERGRTSVLTTSTVVNELVENAVKYGVDRQLDLRAWVEDDVLSLEVVNRATPEQARSLREAVDSLADLSTEDRIRAQAALSSMSSKSGLGLVSIVQQHRVTVGVDLRPVESQEASGVEVVVRVASPI